MTVPEPVAWTRRVGGGPANGSVGAPFAGSSWAGAAAGGTGQAHILCTPAAHRGGKAGSPAAMRKAGDDYATRAETFRRLAGELRNEQERSALLAIAEQYEAVAARLRDDEDDES